MTNRNVLLIVLFITEHTHVQLSEIRIQYLNQNDNKTHVLYIYQYIY